MYETFFNLRERPFELTPNPKFLLLTARHAEALSNLEYGMVTKKAMTLLLGEAGTGKTTVIRTALPKWESAGHRVAYVNNPTLTRAEFVECLADAYGLAEDTRTSKTRLLAALTEFVSRRHAEGHVTGLLIDEAQSLSDELLEEVRLLANLETAAEKIFPVVLAGQPELADRLNTQGLRQLKQRIALRCVLSPLDTRETAAYIAGRVRLAGGVGGQLFTREAVLAIHEHSRGIPRVINVICDNVLLAAFAANCRPATREMVEEVCRDFDLDAERIDPATSKADGRPARSQPATDEPRDSLFETARSHAAAPPDRSESELPETYAPKRRFLPVWMKRVSAR
jgi:general secretion pathway protein A